MKPLAEYTKKRDFKKTAEPKAKVKKSKTPIFVVQEHHASHLHYDFRLEMDGVLKSWAVPKGPSLDPAVKRLAVEVEDHPLDYAGFAGEIPKGEYGGGTVYIWDRGTFLPRGDGVASLKKGRLEFTLKGKKLKGAWILVRTGRPSSKPQWLLIKRHDEFTGEADLTPIVAEGQVPKANAKKAVAVKAGARPKAVARPKAPAKKAAAKAKPVKKKREPLPEFLAPQLAQLVEVPPEGEPWIHELKYDGYRIIARVSNDGVQLFTRNKHDWTAKYPSVRKALEKIARREAYLDGELVWVNEDGTNDFQRLSNLEESSKGGGALGYFVFDLPFLDGEDLRDLPLLKRKEKLADLLAPLQGGPIVYSGHMEEGAAAFLKASCEAKLEGIISKDGGSRYVSGRRDSWVKAKCQLRQEFVIGGFTKEQGSRVGFGALLLGVADDDGLRYVGKVGTGFNQASLLDLRKKFSKLETAGSPFTKGDAPSRGVQWIKPMLVTEVSFANWTNDQHLRAPVFHGLRGDKPVSDVKKEKAEKGSGPAAEAKRQSVKKAIATKPKAPRKAKSSAKGKTSSAASEALPGLTHGEKIIYPTEKLTKENLRDFYVEVAPLLLPHVANRPLSLFRCPSGVGAACFMQKHLNEKLSPGLHAVQVPESSGNTEYVAASSAAGLAALVQKNVIELHAMGSRAPAVDKPDLIVMDFDPAPDVSFKEVVSGARELREILAQLKLESFVKVTGGKGLHVHVPFAPNHGWDKIKAFAHALAREMANRHPELYTTQMAKSARTGKIFLDYLRNGEGATAVVPYSLRAKPISSVAMPVEWEDLGRLKGADKFTLPLALAHLKKRKRDPWEKYFKVKQKLTLLGA